MKSQPIFFNKDVHISLYQTSIFHLKKRKPNWLGLQNTPAASLQKDKT